MNKKAHEITISEDDAKDAIININIARKGYGIDTVYTVTFLDCDDDGTLFLEVYEDANPDTSIANHYPEFFTMYQGEPVRLVEDELANVGDNEIVTILEEDQHTHGLTTTVDGEII